MERSNRLSQCFFLFYLKINPKHYVINIRITICKLQIVIVAVTFDEIVLKLYLVRLRDGLETWVNSCFFKIIIFYFIKI